MALRAASQMLSRDVIKEIEPGLSQLCGVKKRDIGHKLDREMFMLDTR